MADQTLSVVQEETKRFDEADYREGFKKLAVICAGLEALAQTIATNTDPHLSGRLIDASWVLAQTGGFIADHMGENCGGYGDVFTWLEVPRGSSHD